MSSTQPSATPGPVGADEAGAARWLGPVRSVLSTLALTVAFMAVMSLFLSRGPSALPTADVRLSAVEGAPVSLASLQGKPVVLYFWATWCTACKATSPTVSSFAERHPDVQVLGVAVDDPAAVRDYLSTTPRSFRAFVDDGSVAKRFDVRAFPTTYALDRQGKVTWSRQGVLLPGELDWRTPK